MTSEVSRFANARLCVSPQFSVYFEDDDQIFLLSEDRSFRLRGQPYRALVPLLDGTRTRDMLVEALADRVDEDLVDTMLERMISQGYARPFADMPEAEQAFWADCGLEPEQTARALKRFGVAVIARGDFSGSDEAAARRLSGLLGEMGIRPAETATADLVVVLVDDYLDPRLNALHARFRAEGRSWFPIKPRGRSTWIGPVFRPDGRPCHACLQRPLLENRPGDLVVDSGARAVRPAKSATPASLIMAAGLSAEQIVGVALGETALESVVRTFDHQTGESRTHTLRPVSNCPDCGVVSPAPSSTHPAIDLARSAAPLESGSSWRSLSTEEAHGRLARLVSPITGLVDDVQVTAHKDGSYVVMANQKQANTQRAGSGRIQRPSFAGGSGTDPMSATVKCLAEAAERYSCCWTGSEASRSARLEDLGETAIDPRDVMQFSAAQYGNRKTWNEQHGDFNFVPEPFDDRRIIDWSPLWSLTKQTTRWLPTRYCYFSHFQAEEEADENEFCYADSNGCAMGGSLEEAIFHGALELIERDACALFWYNRIQRPQLDLDSFSTPGLQAMRRMLAAMDRTLHILDLTNDIGIPALMAISARKDGSRILMGLGAHLDVERALTSALGEVNMFLVIETAVSGVVEADPDVLDWRENATLDSEAYLTPLAGPKRNRTDFAVVDPMPAAAAALLCQQAIENIGVEVLAMDLSRPEIGLSCARVVAPGLRHFWARLAPGRLFDAPVKLGWLDAPLAECDLNPKPVFV